MIERTAWSMPLWRKIWFYMSGNLWLVVISCCPCRRYPGNAPQMYWTSCFRTSNGCSPWRWYCSLHLMVWLLVNGNLLRWRFFVVATPPVTLYMGRDKVESKSITTRIMVTFYGIVLTWFIDEDLIKYAWPQDVWFHVDKLSSAHVYLRMPDGMSWESIPEDLLTDCAQLVKANSIEGEWLTRL